MLLSSFSDAEDIIKGLDAGADNYITKPYDPAYLICRAEALRKTPIGGSDETLGDLAVTLAGKTYHVKSGRRQTLNLLISTFENAVEKNHELHRLNEQLLAAKAKLTQSNKSLESLNGQLSTANERMRRDLQAAARVQQSLLPSGSTGTARPRLRLERHTPCVELAGDFLSYFSLDERKFGMFVADVSGHGTASSLLAVAVGRLLTGQVSASSVLTRRDPSTQALEVAAPAEVARELNRRFPMNEQDGLYFTIVYGVIDLEIPSLRFVSAGHPPIVYQPKGGEPRMLEGKGFPIGIVENADFDEAAVRLQPGDRIYFYSDGVPEAMNGESQQFTNERMLGVIADGARKPISEAVNSLFESVKSWCAAKGPDDDVSILACEIDPAAH